MKKIFTALVSVLLFVSTLSFPSLAEEEPLPAELWAPVQIELVSEKSYANAYSDVELDAVFTHETGTEIRLPGFWYHDNVYAVRFSPTLTGRWTYKITCSDESNASLTKAGTIEAKESTRDTDLAKHGFVTVREGESYFSYQDGTPFFWLGDTHWQAPNYESTEKCNFPGCTCGSQFDHEVLNRVEKGFTVYQTYFDTGENDGGGARGLQDALWEKQYTLPSASVFNERVDHMFSFLNEQGMAIALGFGCSAATPAVVPLKDMQTFARWIVGRYACYGILWISGQEITSTAATIEPGLSVQSYYMMLSDFVSSLDGYRHPSTAHQTPLDYYSDPISLLSRAPWHDFYLLQDGHGRLYAPKHRYQRYRTSQKPVIEGENNYEDINCGGFVGYDAPRYSAWNALMNGCGGFTYGADGIWANCYSTEGLQGWLNYFNYAPWYMELDKPGSFEVGYMRAFFEALPDWTKLVPCYEDKERVPFTAEDKKLCMITADTAVAVAYFFNDTTDTGTIKALTQPSYTGYWFDPQTGLYRPVSDAIVPENGEVTIPEKPDTGDWAFLLTALSLKKDITLDRVTPDAGPISAPTGTPFTPESVQAVGGAIYMGGKLKDRASVLFDGDTKKAWKPYADRISQTILLDLGTAQKLTAFSFDAGDKTVLPDYRIEGSNDGKTWYKLVNTAVREHEEPYGDVTEALSGTYRYVKVLLLSAETLNISRPVEYKTEAMEAFAEGKYSVTDLRELTLYTDGAGEPEADTVIKAAFEPPETAAPAEPTDAPADEPENNDTNVPVWWPWAAVGGVVGAGLIATAVILLKRRKHE